jgi:hypothetical protein
VTSPFTRTLPAGSGFPAARAIRLIVLEKGFSRLRGGSGAAGGVQKHHALYGGGQGGGAIGASFMPARTRMVQPHKPPPKGNMQRMHSDVRRPPTTLHDCAASCTNSMTFARASVLEGLSSRGSEAEIGGYTAFAAMSRLPVGDMGDEAHRSGEARLCRCEPRWEMSRSGCAVRCVFCSGACGGIAVNRKTRKAKGDGLNVCALFGNISRGLAHHRRDALGSGIASFSPSPSAAPCSGERRP